MCLRFRDWKERCISCPVRRITEPASTFDHKLEILQIKITFTSNIIIENPTLLAPLLIQGPCLN